MRVRVYRWMRGLTRDGQGVGSLDWQIQKKARSFQRDGYVAGQQDVKAGTFVSLLETSG
jgi:hypothetical protein